MNDRARGFASHVAWAGILAVLLWNAAWRGAAQSPMPDSPALWNDEKKHEFLRTAKIVSTRGLGTGITNSRRATLQNEMGTHDAHIQNINESKTSFQTMAGTELNFRDTYLYNIAAYELDRLLGINKVPVTVERKVTGSDSSVTWWVDDVLMMELERYQKKIPPPDQDKWNRQMWILRVFDQLIANTDRNLGNVLITKNWNLWFIDHTRAFRLNRTIREPKNLERCDRRLLQALRELDPRTAEARLKPYLNKKEIEALFARRDQIVRIFDEKIAKQGEAAVLYDYLSARKEAMSSSAQQPAPASSEAH